MIIGGIFLGLALLYLVYLMIRWFNKSDITQIVYALKVLGLGSGFFLWLLTLMTGRLGLFLVIGVLLMPFYSKIYRFLTGKPPSLLSEETDTPETPHALGDSSQSSQHDTPFLTPEEARHILGVDMKATDQDIIKAHKRLIRKIHPDHGGSDYLASRVNQAKDLLINSKHTSSN